MFKIREIRSIGKIMQYSNHLCLCRGFDEIVSYGSERAWESPGSSFSEAERSSIVCLKPVDCKVYTFMMAAMVQNVFLLQSNTP